MNFRLLAAIALSLPLFLNNVKSQTLDDVLNEKKSLNSDKSSETQLIFKKLMVSMDSGDLTQSKSFADEYLKSKDTADPRQKTIVLAVVDLVNLNLNPSSTGNAEEQYKTEIEKHQATIKTNDSEINLLKDKNSELQKIAQVNLTSDQSSSQSSGQQVASIFGNVAGNVIGAAVNGIAESQKQDQQKRQRQQQQQILSNQNQINSLRDSNNELRTKISDLRQRESIALQALKSNKVREEKRILEDISRAKSKTYNLALDLYKNKYLVESAALCNLATRKFGNEETFLKLSQSIVELEKFEKKAEQIAEIVVKPARLLLNKGLIYQSRDEYAKSAKAVNEKGLDPQLMKLIQDKITPFFSDLSAQIESSTIARNMIMKISDTDPILALKEYEKFVMQHSDYPEIEVDRQKIRQIRTQQIEAKLTKRLALIDEVIQNDPNEAREMIKRLISDNTEPDEISLIRSRVSKLEKQILQTEVKRIEQKIDEAQSYLTKWNVTYAAELKKGGSPEADFKASISGGIENLTRAISVQDGAAKQISILLGQPMDLITKSQLIGLQQTAVAALETMKKTKEQTDSNKKLVNLITYLLITIVAIAAGYLIFRNLSRRKTV